MSKSPAEKPRFRDPMEGYRRVLKHRRNKRIRSAVSLTGLALLGSLAALFFSGHLVIGGIPASILMMFLQDEIARDAFLQGDRQGLHARLSEMGVEEMMKDYYRPRIADEAELDRYVHQLFYDRTGYVGEAYRVSPNGKLVRK
ncbi:MAG: hypothetical protein IGS50_11995 [Synechococcales cyanobacterium C42_A2020_086]|jgi:hypothetical protein|nr:hypothetical protein [Synechococcales cyanobacterium C42_A2020_086]